MSFFPSCPSQIPFASVHSSYYQQLTQIPCFTLFQLLEGFFQVLKYSVLFILKLHFWFKVLFTTSQLPRQTRMVDLMAADGGGSTQPTSPFLFPPALPFWAWAGGRIGEAKVSPWDGPTGMLQAPLGWFSLLLRLTEEWTPQVNWPLVPSVGQASKC